MSGAYLNSPKHNFRIPGISWLRIAGNSCHFSLQYAPGLLEKDLARFSDHHNAGDPGVFDEFGLMSLLQGLEG